MRNHVHLKPVLEPTYVKRPPFQTPKNEFLTAFHCVKRLLMFGLLKQVWLYKADLSTQSFEVICLPVFEELCGQGMNRHGIQILAFVN